MRPDIPKVGNAVKRFVAQLGARRGPTHKGILPKMGKSLKELRENRGWTHDEAAAAMGMSRGGYIKLERGERRLTVDRISKAAAIYRVTQSSIIDANVSIKIIGEVGPGGVVRMYNAESEPVTAPRPTDATPTTSALEIRGGALPGVAEDHWLVFYDHVCDGLPDERIGELCVVALEDGVVIRIGRVYHSRNPGTFDVVTQGYDPVRGVSVKWSALVTWIKPR